MILYINIVAVCCVVSPFAGSRSSVESSGCWLLAAGKKSHCIAVYHHTITSLLTDMASPHPPPCIAAVQQLPKRDALSGALQSWYLDGLYRRNIFFVLYFAQKLLLLLLNTLRVRVDSFLSVVESGLMLGRSDLTMTERRLNECVYKHNRSSWLTGSCPH